MVKHVQLAETVDLCFVFVDECRYCIQSKLSNCQIWNCRLSVVMLFGQSNSIICIQSSSVVHRVLTNNQPVKRSLGVGTVQHGIIAHTTYRLLQVKTITWTEHLICPRLSTQCCH